MYSTGCLIPEEPSHLSLQLFADQLQPYADDYKAHRLLRKLTVSFPDDNANDHALVGEVILGDYNEKVLELDVHNSCDILAYDGLHVRYDSVEDGFQMDLDGAAK